VTADEPGPRPLEANPPRRSGGRRLGQVLAAVAGLALFVFSLRGTDPREALRLIARLGPLLPLVLVPQLVGALSETFSWRSAFRRLGGRVRYRALLQVRLVADALVLSLPSGSLVADVSQPYLLKRACGLSFPRALAGTVIRKHFVMLGHGLVLMLSALVAWGPLQQASRAILGRGGLPQLLFATGLVIAALAMVLVAAFVYGRLAERAGRLALGGLAALLPRVGHRGPRLPEADQHLRRFFGQSHLRLATILPGFLLAWLALGVESWVYLRLLGVDDLPVTTVLFIEPGITLVRLLIVVVPGGLGVQEFGYVVLLRGLGLADAAGVAAAFALLKRGKQVFYVAVGYLLLALGRRAAPPPGSSGSGD